MPKLEVLGFGVDNVSKISATWRYCSPATARVLINQQYFHWLHKKNLPCQGRNSQIEGKAFPGLGAPENGLNDLG
jgi:hypothetical protein